MAAPIFRRKIPTGGRVQPLAFHPRLPHLAVGTETTVRILDVDTGQTLTVDGGLVMR